jgi:hypothetical protein
MTDLLIALYSPAPQSGKSTLAEHLTQHRGYELVKFAGPLKDMLRCLLFDHCGIDHATTERYVDGDLKEQFVPEIGVTTRHLMQTLGTEWGRDHVRSDLWVHLARQSVMRHIAAGKRVVIDDMRFQNEWMMVRDLGGQVVRIERGDAPAQDFGHASEGGLNNVPMTLLRNDGSLDDFLLAADRLLGYA